jgi:hypothetical protein
VSKAAHLKILRAYLARAEGNAKHYAERFERETARVNAIRAKPDSAFVSRGTFTRKRVLGWANADRQKAAENRKHALAEAAAFGAAIEALEKNA